MRVRRVGWVGGSHIHKNTSTTTNKTIISLRAGPSDVEECEGGVAELMAEMEHLLAPRRQHEDLFRHASCGREQ